MTAYPTFCLLPNTPTPAIVPPGVVFRIGFAPDTCGLSSATEPPKFTGVQSFPFPD